MASKPVLVVAKDTQCKIGAGTVPHENGTSDRRVRDRPAVKVTVSKSPLVIRFALPGVGNRDRQLP